VVPGRTLKGPLVGARYVSAPTVHQKTITTVFSRKEGINKRRFGVEYIKQNVNGIMHKGDI